MLITCEHCTRQLNLPDEKVPAHAFALNCPNCQGRIEVDPTATPAAPEPVAPAPVQEPLVAPPAASAQMAAPAPAEQPPAQQPASGNAAFEPLLPMRDLERDLLAHLYPMAGIVNLTGGADQHIEQALKMLNMNEVMRFTESEAAAEAMKEIELSILVVLVDKAAAPPFPPLEPIQKLPLDLRRGTFVALMANNVKSLDGQTAFYLQVNCLINAQEVSRIPISLQRALLFHLRHYRHWHVERE